MNKSVLVALAMVVANAAVAQNAPRSDPNDPSAAVPVFTYRSAFEGYRPFVEQEVEEWRKANEEVRAAGGHKGDAAGQAARKKAPARPPASPASKSPAPQGHGGHK